MPRRILFEGSQKAQELNLANTGLDTARYTISIIDIRMKEDGSFEIIDKPDSGQQFAGKYLRFFPHSVTLGPNESQVIKLQLSRTSELTPGEYRSHIYFRAEPDGKTVGVVEPSRDSSISIKLVPVFGISIPAIIRVGQTEAQVDLANVSLQPSEDGTARLGLAINRRGNRSVYGDLTVTFFPVQGKRIVVTSIKGIAVYTPNESRKVLFDLPQKQGVNYHAGRLQVVYAAGSDMKPERYAEAEWVLHD